jgi:DNA-binding transcriptional MerR regulator
MQQSNEKSFTFKIPQRLFRIGDIVRNTPFSRQTIHNYTIMGLIKEAQWTEGGHRLYDESVFEQLSRIMELKKTKTLAEIRKILKHRDNSDFQNSYVNMSHN